jgi:hypothetical protein
MRTPHLSISSKLVSTNNSYIILAVDLNVLRNATVHTTLLHWFATGLVSPACSDPGRQKNPAHAGSVPVQPGPTTLDIPGAYYLGPTTWNRIPPICLLAVQAASKFRRPNRVLSHQSAEDPTAKFWPARVRHHEFRASDRVGVSDRGELFPDHSGTGVGSSKSAKHVL